MSSSISASHTKEVIFNIQMQNKVKGMNCIKILRKLYYESDYDQSGKLNREELYILFAKARIFLSRQDVNMMFNYFDVNRD